MYYVVANNGNGGSASTTTTGGNPTGGSNPATPAGGTARRRFAGVHRHVTCSATFRPSNQFADQIYGLSNQGVITGYFDGTFRPNVTVTRQAFAAFIARYLHDEYPYTPAATATTPAVATASTSGPCNDGSGSYDHNSNFSDVPNSSQFCSEINSLNGLGIIDGYPNGTFKPLTTVTREAEAAFVYRTYVYENNGNNAVPPNSDAVCTVQHPFTDVSKGDTFCGDIQFLKDNGLSNGYAGRQLPPAGRLQPRRDRCVPVPLRAVPAPGHLTGR